MQNQKSFRQLVLCAKSGNNAATEELITCFRPLFIKYAHKLSPREVLDEVSDFTIDFLELIHHINPSAFKNDRLLLSYIQKSIANSFIKKARKRQRAIRINYLCELSDEQRYRLEEMHVVCDDYFDAITLYAHKLTCDEFKLLRHIIYDGFTVSEIAAYYGISRQAVNAAKNRALKKLKGSVSQNML